MKEVTISITVKGDGEVVTESSQMAAGVQYDPNEEMAEEDAERYAIVSDIADVCDYLEDSEVIRIKLIIQKAKARKERAENS